MRISWPVAGPYSGSWLSPAVLGVLFWCLYGLLGWVWGSFFCSLLLWVLHRALGTRILCANGSEPGSRLEEVCIETGREQSGCWRLGKQQEWVPLGNGPCLGTAEGAFETDMALLAAWQSDID